MSQKRNQTHVLITSGGAILAIVAVLFWVKQLNSRNQEPPSEIIAADAPSDDSENSISLTVNGKHVDSTDTRFDGSPEDLIGHISDTFIKATNTGDLDPFINLIGKSKLSPSQIKHLKELATQSKQQLNQNSPFSPVEGSQSRWALNLQDQQNILLDLTKTSEGKWQVDSIALPTQKIDQPPNSIADKKGSADTTATPTSNDAKAQATATVQAFINAVIKLDPSTASQFTDPEHVSYATIAGLCIIFEEGRYLPTQEKALRNMFITANAAGWVARIETPETKKPDMFALSTKRKDAQSEWKITEINLDKLLADYASQFSGGGSRYVPLIKNLKGGDSIVLYFELDSNTLTERTQRQLKIIANLLKSTPDKKLSISGHTDALGSDLYNLNLSNQRAQQVMTYLASQGLPSQQMKTTSFGKTQPRLPNNTNEGRRANRRAEIVLDF